MSGVERAHRLGSAVADEAALERRAERRIVGRRLRDGDRVVRPEREVDLDERASGLRETLAGGGDPLVPVLDRLDALIGEAHERDVPRHG